VGKWDKVGARGGARRERGERAAEGRKSAKAREEEQGRLLLLCVRSSAGLWMQLERGEHAAH
jgi:hypothetical protein